MHRETWKPVPGYEEFYAVSSLGRVKRIKDGGPVKAGCIVGGYPDECGYTRVRMCTPHSKRQFRAHQLVMLAFVGPANGRTVNHINRIRTDNRLANLEYLSHADNIRHSRDSYSRKGELNSRAIFSAEDVRTIRKMYADGTKVSTLIEKFGRKKCAIYDVLSRRCWKHI